MYTIHSSIILMTTKPCIYFQNKLLLKRTFCKLKNLHMIMVQPTKMHRTRVCTTQAHVHQRVAKNFNVYLICQHHSLVYMYCAGGNKQLCSRGIKLPQFELVAIHTFESVVDNTQKDGGLALLTPNKRILKRVAIIKNIYSHSYKQSRISPRH